MAWHLDGIRFRIDLFRRVAIAGFAISAFLAWLPDAVHAQGSHWSGQTFSGRPYNAQQQATRNWGACDQLCRADSRCRAWTAQDLSGNSQLCKLFDQVTTMYMAPGNHSGTIAPRSNVANPTHARVLGPKINGLYVSVSYRNCGSAENCELTAAMKLCEQRGYTRVASYRRGFPMPDFRTWDVITNGVCMPKGGCLVMEEVTCSR